MHGHFQRSQNFCMKCDKNVQRNNISSEKVIEGPELQTSECILSQWSPYPVPSILRNSWMSRLKESNSSMEQKGWFWLFFSSLTFSNYQIIILFHDLHWKYPANRSILTETQYRIQLYLEAFPPRRAEFYTIVLPKRSNRTKKIYHLLFHIYSVMSSQNSALFFIHRVYNNLSNNQTQTELKLCPNHEGILSVPSARKNL